MNLHRIFVAFPLPHPLREKFSGVKEKNDTIEGIRWTPDRNLHITLFFIGEVVFENIQLVKLRLIELFKYQSPFHLSFDSIIFKGRKNPSMIWAAFHKNNEFTSLNEKIYKSVKEFMTIVPVHKEPIPHCTLARIKSNAGISKVNLEFPLEIETRILIDSAELWVTVQTEAGVRYESLERFAMEGF